MKVSVVVTSCDHFSECWEPFIKSIDKHWGDCPWDINIISNYQSIKSEKVKFINVGEDKGWASNLKVALKQIDSNYIIYLHEDYFLNGKVNSEIINEHIIYCANNNVDYLRLFGPFFDQFSITGTNYSLSPKSKSYRLCLRNSIWKKESFEKLLIDGSSAWEFEWYIEKYISNNNLSIKSYVLQSQYYPSQAIPSLEHTAVHKGMWTQQGYDFLKENGFENILNKREKEGFIITYIIENENKWIKPFLSIVLRFLIRFKINI